MNGREDKRAMAAIPERFWVIGGLLGVSGVSWVYTIRMAQRMAPSGHSAATATEHCGHQLSVMPILNSAAMPHLANWDTAETWMTFVMWVVMMAGMMLPTTIPMVLAFVRINRQSDDSGVLVPVTGFIGGYLSAWTLYSAGATMVQLLLLRSALLSPQTLASGPILGGLLLIGAGIFQWTTWKNACMEKCRNPLGFLLTHWQPGRLGAFRLGSRFGLYCIGCCWLLMLICFALGVMNLVWMGVVTIFMLVEKTASAGPWISRAAGVILVIWGGWMLVA